MPSSTSRPDESNSMLWLVTWAGKIELSCPLGTHHVQQEKFPRSHIVNPLLINFFWSRWLDIGLVCFFVFCEFMDLDSVLVHRENEKKNLANIQPSLPHTWSITHIYSSVCLIGTWCYKWNCLLLTEFTHKVTSLLQDVWRSRIYRWLKT